MVLGTYSPTICFWISSKLVSFYPLSTLFSSNPLLLQNSTAPNLKKKNILRSSINFSKYGKINKNKYLRGNIWLNENIYKMFKSLIFEASKPARLSTFGLGVKLLYYYIIYTLLLAIS